MYPLFLQFNWLFCTKCTKGNDYFVALSVLTCFVEHWFSVFDYRAWAQKTHDPLCRQPILDKGCLNPRNRGWVVVRVRAAKLNKKTHLLLQNNHCLWYISCRTINWIEWTSLLCTFHYLCLWTCTHEWNKVVKFMCFTNCSGIDHCIVLSFPVHSHVTYSLACGATSIYDVLSGSTQVTRLSYEWGPCTISKYVAST